MGGADFGFAFGDDVPASASRSSSSAATSAWCCGRFRASFLTFEQLGMPPMRQAALSLGRAACSSSPGRPVPARRPRWRA